MRSSNAVRVLVLSGLALGSLGSLCNPVSIFVCESDDDCEAHGPKGRCESNLACSFEDERCPEGRRWHSRADQEAGECLGRGIAGTSGDSGDDTETGSSGETPGSGSEEAAASLGGESEDSGLPQSTSAGSTTSSGETSGSSTSTSTSTGQGTTTTTSSESGATQTCDEQYGSVLEYQRCAETPDRCTFNVRVDMSASCDQVCAMAGSVCVIADLNDAADLCVSIGQIPCDDMSFVDGICTCSRE